MKIFLVRHGNTGKNKDDDKRELTEHGRTQAVVLKEALGTDYELVLTSPKLRARQTTNVLTQRSTAPRIIVPELYRHPNDEAQAVCDALYDELKYAPLHKYFAHPEGGRIHEVGQYGKSRILGQMQQYGLNPLKPGRVLVVSHAVIINAIVYAFSDDTINQQMALEMTVDECGGFVIADGAFAAHFSLAGARNYR